MYLLKFAGDFVIKVLESYANSLNKSIRGCLSNYFNALICTLTPCQIPYPDELKRFKILEFLLLVHYLTFSKHKDLQRYTKENNFDISTFPKRYQESNTFNWNSRVFTMVFLFKLTLSFVKLISYFSYCRRDLHAVLLQNNHPENNSTLCHCFYVIPKDFYIEKQD